MRAELIRSVGSLAAAAAEGPFVVRVPFVPFYVWPFELVNTRDGAVYEGVWDRRSYPSGPVAS